MVCGIWFRVFGRRLKVLGTRFKIFGLGLKLCVVSCSGFWGLGIGHKVEG